MKKTENFFVIHNYNTVPEQLLKYCKEYIIYDASENVTKESLNAKGISYLSVENTGHNITSYFRFFIDYYEKLPEVICLLKGNILGRHCSEQYFNKVYDNKFFTFLYEDYETRQKLSKKGKSLVNSSYLLGESRYLEINNSWYVGSKNHPHRYFDNVDRLLTFIYKDPVISDFMCFSPGACYIIRKEQILKNSKTFYINLLKIMNYGLQPSFPSEAHQIERILPIIFENSYEVNEWMEDEVTFDKQLQIEKAITEKNDILREKIRIENTRWGTRIKRKIKKLL